MYRILRNTFLTSRSGLRVVTSMDEEPELYEQLPDKTTPETLLLHRRDFDRLRTAIEGLPLQFREVLLLSDVEEMSYRDIAETLSIPIGTVMSRLMRARRRVREAMILPIRLKCRSRALWTVRAVSRNWPIVR